MAVVATSIVLNFTRGVWLGCVVAILYVVARWKPRTLWAIPVLLFVAYLAAPINDSPPRVTGLPPELTTRRWQFAWRCGVRV